MEENKAKALAKKAERERAKLLEAAAAQLEQEEQNHEVKYFWSFFKAAVWPAFCRCKNYTVMISIKNNQVFIYMFR